MENTGGRTGWVGYTGGPGGKDHLSPEVRAEIQRLEAAREERRGRLLCEVHVRVYEREAVPGVAFPADSLLDPESDPQEVATAVARAQEELTHWR